MILDENNSENIVLYGSDGEETEFEQVAVIPYEGEVYVILHPLDMPELGDDEAFVFKIAEEDGEGSLELVEDDETVDKIFNLYYDLFEEEA